MGDPVNDLKRELVAAAERQAALPRLRSRLGRPRLVLASAALATAAAAALLLTAPWSSSPSFLARAEAALKPPAGTVLHQKWVATTTSAEFGCTVTHRPSEAWIDQSPPHRYRVELNDAPPPKLLDSAARELACWNGKGIELVGALDSRETREVVGPGELRFVRPRFVTPFDLVADLRRSLDAGRAHHEGRATRGGRTVERVRIDPETRCAAAGCSREPFYWYVDPQTFHPVEMEGPAEIVVPGKPAVRLRIVMRFQAYEYLPRAAAPRELTETDGS